MDYHGAKEEHILPGLFTQRE